MFPLGIAIAVSVRVSQAVGAREWARVRPIGFGGVGMAMAVMGLFAVGFLLLRVPLVGFFVRDAATAALAAQLLAVAGIFQVFDGVQVVSMGALRGLSDVKIPTLISFVSYWVVALPLCYGLGIAGKSQAVGDVVGVWRSAWRSPGHCCTTRFYHQTRAVGAIAAHDRLGSSHSATLRGRHQWRDAVQHHQI